MIEVWDPFLVLGRVSAKLDPISKKHTATGQPTFFLPFIIFILFLLTSVLFKRHRNRKKMYVYVVSN